MKKKEIIECLNGEHDSVLFKQANEMKERYFHKNVFIRGLIEFSNYCIRNCNYCGLRKDNSQLRRYRLTHEDIVETVRSIDKSGIKTIVLQSGEDYGYTKDMVLL